MQQNTLWAQASLPQLANALKSRMRQVVWRRLAPLGLSPQQFQLLVAIAEQDGRCHGDLARRTWMDKPTTSRVLKTLQDRGLVRADADPGHGRRLRFHLQPAAEALMPDLEDVRRYMRVGMQRGLEAADLDRLREILAVIMDNLDRMEAELLAGERDTEA